MDVLIIASLLAIFLTCLASSDRIKRGLEIAFIILAFIYAIRYNFGTDYWNYYAKFIEAQKYNSLKQCFWHSEFGWYILNYLFKVHDLEEIMNKHMPLHIVEKKIPYINDDGEIVKPDEPNGYKFEMLVLDMIHLLDSCLPFEVVREKEFAPIKNKTGVDSVETARELLKQNGVEL